MDNKIKDSKHNEYAKLNVFFNLRSSSRERMWDSARQACRVCNPILPSIQKQTSIARTAAKKHENSFIENSKKIFLRTFPLLNHQSVPESEKANLLYMWGAFPKGSSKPFIIELDNPYVVSYYNQTVFSIRLKKIKQKLREAKALTYLSNTARNHSLALLGKEFENKSFTLPPFMERNYKNNKRLDDGIVRFLFVGLGYRRKGLPEFLEAFTQVDERNIHLTVVSNIDIELQDKYKNDTRITFLPPQSREKLFTVFYPTHDVFVLPSLLESLGVVILEALSFGMGIITTDLYATPEMVKNGKNGLLISHPFLSHSNLNDTSVIDCVSTSSAKFQKQYLNDMHSYPTLVNDLTNAIHTSRIEYKNWQDASIELFEDKYAPNIWEERLHNIITYSLNK